MPKLLHTFPGFHSCTFEKNALFQNRKSRVVGKYFVVVMNTVLFFAIFIICLFFDKNISTKIQYQNNGRYRLAPINTSLLLL